MTSPMDSTTDDLQAFVQRPAPRNLAELDAMALDPIRKMSQVRPFLITWVLIAYPIPTVIFASSNRDDLSVVFFITWLILAALIGALGSWSQRRLGIKHVKLLQSGQASEHLIVKKVPRSRAHRKSSVQGFEVEPRPRQTISHRADGPRTPGAPQSMLDRPPASLRSPEAPSPPRSSPALGPMDQTQPTTGERQLMLIPMATADHLEEGMSVWLLRHDEFVNALWLLPDGLPPMMTLLNPR